MGKYFVNSGDISNKNLNRGWHAMMVELETIVSETKAVREELIARQDMRDNNFLESGGVDAFTPEELMAHDREHRRLETHFNRCNVIISELDNRVTMMRVGWKLDG